MRCWKFCWVLVLAVLALGCGARGSLQVKTQNGFDAAELGRNRVVLLRATTGDSEAGVRERELTQRSLAAAIVERGHRGVIALPLRDPNMGSLHKELLNAELEYAHHRRLAPKTLEAISWRFRARYVLTSHIVDLSQVERVERRGEYGNSDGVTEETVRSTELTLRVALFDVEGAALRWEAEATGRQSHTAGSSYGELSAALVGVTLNAALGQNRHPEFQGVADAAASQVARQLMPHG